MIDRILIGAEDLAMKTKKFLLNKEKISVLATPINTEFFKPKDKNKLRKDLKIGLDEKVVIFVGRISYLKGSDFLLKVIKQNPEKKFILIGRFRDKNYNLDELKNVVYIKEIEREKLIDYYNVSDLCLFLSRTEGLGLAFREAMSCGTPTIVSDIEALRTVKTAVKVPFDIEKIQEKIDWFFKLTSSQRLKLSKETRKNIVEDYSEESLKKAHIDFLFKF